MSSPTPPNTDPSKHAPEVDFAAQIFKIVADQHGLNPNETLLLAVCECALRIDVNQIAAILKQTRVSKEQVQLHAIEIGADKELRSSMVDNIQKFVQFFTTLQKLKIVELEGKIHNRTLLGYHNIKIIEKQKWQSVIHFACDSLEYFGSKITVYERLMDFGYGPLHYTPRTRNKDPALPRPTTMQKKSSLLLNTPHWKFVSEKLDRNVKRYTNGHNKPKENSLSNVHTKPTENLNSLNLLARVAMEAGEK